ncbi:MAG: DUF4317 domain-containing protein [Oscillospiraceae bacterium]|nr:DUF4317 domain-containing protein [Oscillospiraceae bacterium]
MTQKELNEIRRRFRLERSGFNRIYGCYVNGNKGVISHIDASLGMMPQDEAEMYMKLLKKTLSGALGRNLINIEFATRQVADSEEHRLLQTLRNTELKDERAREQLYSRIIDRLDLEGSNYLILMAADCYDVPFRGKDDALQSDASDQVFRYFVCCVCPVKDASLELRYVHEEGTFHGLSTGNTVSAPEVGFMFPCFDDRSTNIYNALFYTKSVSEIHQELIDSVFRVDPPMSAPEQKAVFDSTLQDVLEKDCSYDVVQSVHDQIRTRIEEHKESKAPQNLELTIGEVGSILGSSGVSAEKVKSFEQACEKQYGDRAVLNPKNIVESKKFEIVTPEVKISVSPEHSYVVETRVINGRKYFLIPADQSVEVNGIPVTVEE